MKKYIKNKLSTMKRYIAGMLVLFVVAVATKSCDLDTYPTGSVGPVDIFGTTENARMAVRGISRLMVQQYHQFQPYNGEGTIKMWYGDHAGHNMVRDFPGWAANFNWTFFNAPANSWNWYPWGYYYRLIGQANAIIDNIDGATGPQSERDQIRAQALTYRAYSYFMLSQIYSPRWENATQAQEARGLILRLSADTPDDFPFSSLYETYEQIYEDLKRAIEYFRSAGITREGTHDININVAQGILARAALTRQDWALAAEMAAAARIGYPLMTNDEMMGGFYLPNREWIWNSAGATDEQIWWYAFHSQMGWNATDGLWGHFAMITRELFAQIPDNDVRRNWWFPPVGPGMAPGDRSVATAAANLPSGMTVEQATAYFDEFHAKVMAFSNSQSRGIPAANQPWISHYQQVKIGRGIADPGVGFLLHMRSTEMFLIEAEARARMGQYAQAQQLLVTLHTSTNRLPGFTTVNTGQTLIEEVWLWRDIELWGEGFAWFDLKRTNRPLVRTRKDQGGSFLTALVLNLSPTDRNGWIFSIPERETDFNRLAVWPRP